VIPMHFKTEKSSNKAYEDDLGDFAKMFDIVTEYGDCNITINEKALHVEPQLFILEYLKEN
ncbi:MAG: hypothetical protein JSW33_04955, partial [bacterium]